MRLVVKQADNVVSELRFTKGPVYIGRQTGSQVFLPVQAVSRQHAVIYSNQDDKWFVEDLGSANKTYLNDQAVHKVKLKDGDLLRIADFNISVYFDNNAVTTEQRVDLADTLKTAAYEPETIIRKIKGSDAPIIRMPAKRASDFRKAIATLSKASSPEKLQKELLDILMRQFAAFRVWVGLRRETTGPMAYHIGKKNNGETVKLGTLEFREKITYAAEKKAYTLVPHLPARTDSGRKDRIRSAIISPVVSQDGCYGVLYVDNTAEHEHYSLTDLDYLMFLAMHTATIMQKL